MVVPYRPGAGGRLGPEIPDEGPCRGTVGGACRLVEDHWRDRTTGPCFPLLVMRCLTHRRGFTLYPLGHVPYGRLAIAPVSPAGAPTGGEPDRFVGTVFAAAFDASRGMAWPREGSGREDGYWPTMCRRLKDTEVWLGVAPGLGDKEREGRAADLDVDLLPLLTGAAAIRAAPGYKSRGAAVVMVLEELPEGLPLLECLLRAGRAAGLFGEPLVPVRPGGPLRSLARERPASTRSSPGRDPPRKRDVPSSRRGS